MAAQRPPQRIGIVVGARLTLPAWAAAARPLSLILTALLLLGELLRALAQGLRGAPLRTNGAIRIALAERALGLAHGALGFAETFLGAFSLALLTLSLLALLTLLAQLTALAHLFHQLVELVAQRLLVLPQLAELVRIALLILLALLTALATLSALALLIALLVLPLLEGLVAQVLLLADHVAKLVQRRHVVIAVVALLRLRHLQVFEHLLQLFEQFLGRVLGAGACKLLHPVDHVFQILRPQHAGILVELALRLLRVLTHLLGERLHELVERRAQIFGELLDFLVGRATLQRLTQGFLCLARRGLGVGKLAVLDHARHAPQPRHDVAQLVVGLRIREQEVNRAQAEILRDLRHETCRRDRERIERRHHVRLRFGIERQIAPLLGQGAGQRLEEHALRQREFGRFARPLIAGLIARGQRQRHFGAGPRMIREVLGGLPGAVAGARLRQHQREVRRAIKRTQRAAVGGLVLLERENRLRADHAVVVFHLVGELQRAARLRLRVLGERDRRRAVRNGCEREGHVVVQHAAQRRGAAVRDGVAVFLGAGGRRRRALAACLGEASRGDDVEPARPRGADHQ